MSLITGCSKNRGKDLAGYLNNTLEYMISNYGVSFSQQEDGTYANEDGSILVTVKDNLVWKIDVKAKLTNSNLEGIRVGDKKKRVDKTLRDELKKDSTVEKDEESKRSVHQYKSDNRILVITYNDTNLVEEISMEVSAYVVENSSTGTSGVAMNKNSIMVQVGNIEVSYSEAMVYLRTAQGIYEKEFGNDVWSFDLHGDGTTIGTILKQEVLNQIIQLEIINIVATEKGITLSDDELYEVRMEATEFMKQISEKECQEYGITEELVVQVFATNRIAEKLYETVTIDVDTDVSDEQAQQCKIYKLFLRTYGTDSKGNHTQLRESELEEIKTRIEELHTKALEGEDFYALADSNSDEDVIEYVVGRGDLSEVEEKAAFSLKDGEVSDILKVEDGYIIIYCVDAYDEDATLQVKEQIIEQRRSSLFVELYTQWYSNYEVKVNMELWNKLELSPITQ